ncbi:hypothetical protein MNBD_ALPHA04-221 [hydrothermal vent metagenome]|uniref:Uncharacterized protein n=1 Tax=hydrothermal vent metagenome TaxID=652676 RepID=A0A3B0R6Y6_9ZZZZ
MLLGLGAVAVIAIGALGGLLLGNEMKAEIAAVDVSPPPPPSDPVERFELGQNSYASPKVKKRPSYSAAGKNQNLEYGKKKNGKRVLVVGESALKKERQQSEQDQRDIDKWHDEYFGRGEE